VFLDRDGTINEDTGYPKEPEQIRLINGVGPALKALQDRGFRLVIVSNQSGIGRGMLNEDEAKRVHRRVLSSLSEYGVQIDAAYYCPHAPDESCSCRKPLPEMVFRAADDLNIDLGQSFLVGNKQSDIETGKRAGCRTILLVSHETDKDAGTSPDYVAADWQEILQLVLSNTEI